MAKLEEQLAAKVEELRAQFIQFKMNNDYEKGEPLLIEAWGLLPEPKVVYDESFHIATYAVDNCITLKKYVDAKKWSDILFHCDLERHDSGEREYKAAKVAFELEEFELAKKHFTVANEKSKGRVFKRGDDIKYFKFFKQK